MSGLTILSPLNPLSVIDGRGSKYIISEPRAGLMTPVPGPPGSVTSVGLTTPLGFENSAAVTSSGVINITYADGYEGFTSALKAAIDAAMPKTGGTFSGSVTFDDLTTFNGANGASLLFSRGSVGKWLLGTSPDDYVFMTSYVNDPAGKSIFVIDPEGPEGVGTPEIRTYISSFAEVHSAGHAVTDSMRIIGFSGIAFNDNTTNIQNVYGIYGEAVRDAGAGAAQASEFNGANGGNVVDITPYSALGSVTTSTWLSAGLTTRPDHNNPLSAAGVMINNGGTFRRGWVLRAGALDPAGPMDFMAVPVGTRLSWYGESGQRTDQIFSASTSANAATTMVLADSSVNFYNNQSSQPFFSIVNTGAAATNFLQIQSAPDGYPVLVSAAGSDDDIDLKLVPKGLGKVVMGAYATSGDTPVVGYMVVKDASGNERKLAVIA